MHVYSVRVQRDYFDVVKLMQTKSHPFTVQLQLIVHRYLTYMQCVFWSNNPQSTCTMITLSQSVS